MRQRLIICCAMLALQACSSITFVQNEQPGEQEAHTQWHHLAINGMVELSKPLDVREMCGERTWNTITTEYSFTNGLVGLLVPSVPFLVPYTPWTNRVECYQPTPPLKPESE